MIPFGLSMNKMAIALRVPVTRIANIVNEKRGITTDPALRFAPYFSKSTKTNPTPDVNAIAKIALPLRLRGIMRSRNGGGGDFSKASRSAHSRVGSAHNTTQSATFTKGMKNSRPSHNGRPASRNLRTVIETSIQMKGNAASTMVARNLDSVRVRWVRRAAPPSGAP